MKIERFIEYKIETHVRREPIYEIGSHIPRMVTVATQDSIEFIFDKGSYSLLCEPC